MNNDTLRRSVVVGTDGSPLADDAVHWALEYARARRLPLRVTPLADVRRPDPEQLDRALDAAVQLCRATAPELTVTEEHPTGDTVEGLLASARDATVLVVGATGHDHVSAALDGRADCPVAFVDSRRWPDPATPVIAGVKGGPQDEAILRLAFDMAVRCVAPLIVAHVRREGQSGAPDPLFVHGLAPWEAQYPDVQVRHQTLGGPPSVALSALTHRAGLLVVGAGHTGIAGLAVRFAHCPVLIAR